MPLRDDVDRAIECWNSGDRETWKTLAARDLDYGAGGYEGWVGTFDNFHTGFPDTRFELLSFLESGDAIAYEIRFTGTQTGVFRLAKTVIKPDLTDVTTLRPSGSAVEFAFGAFATYENGQVKKLHVYGVGGALMEALGVGMAGR